jgi:carbon monoxide dehydrogenase subunit G
MPSLSEQITIPASPPIVWRLLADPGLAASCIPGATLTPTAVAGVYQGSIRIRLGPTSAMFRGEVRLAYFSDAMHCTVEGRGIDDRGESRAVGSGAVTAAGSDVTVLEVEGGFEAIGPLADLVEAAGLATARALLASFEQNLTKLVTGEGTPAPDAEEIPMVEPETVARQVRAVAMHSAEPAAAEEPEGAARRRGLPGWLRRIIPGKE